MSSHSHFTQKPRVYWCLVQMAADWAKEKTKELFLLFSSHETALQEEGVLSLSRVMSERQKAGRGQRKRRKETH
jgi:hypothetical protein